MTDATISHDTATHYPATAAHMDISRARADEWWFLVGEADSGPSITEYPGFPQIHEVILSGYRPCEFRMYVPRS